MQIKKFVGENSSDVMALIKEEFGDDAIIIETNTLKTGGFMGLFQKDQVEILAALDEEMAKKASPKKNLEKKNKKNSESRYSDGIQYDSSGIKNDEIEADLSPQEQKTEYQTGKTNEYQRPARSIKDNRPLSQEEIQMRDDIDSIKETVFKLNQKINETFKTSDEELALKEFDKRVKMLENTGISNSLSKKIIENLKNFGSDFNSDNVYSAIINLFSEYKDDDEKAYRYNIFIGSTGVGKTTTLAKIASNTAIKSNQKLGFLTLDTYRISAVDQLKTYAQILSTPIEVSYELADIQGAIGRLASRDIIFIDTAGRSHNNKKQMTELKNIIQALPEKKIFLFISANTNLDDIYDIIDSYDFLEDYNIIVTKIDETQKIGKIFDIINYSKKSISFTTCGQNVPDDIQKFNFRNFAIDFAKEIDFDEGSSS